MVRKIGYTHHFLRFAIFQKDFHGKSKQIGREM